MVTTFLFFYSKAEENKGVSDMHKKLLVAPFIAMIVLSMIFISTQIPMTKMAPKELPVGFVVSDEGPLGEMLAENLQKALASNEAVKVIAFENEQQMNDALNERELYGAIVIPDGFSSAVQSLATPNPGTPQMNYFINEGENANVSTMLTNVFTQMNTQINTIVRTQLVGQLTEVNAQLQPAQVETFVEPIQANIQKVNATGALATAPTAFFQPLWFSAIIGAVLLFLAGKKADFQTKREQLQFNGVQTAVGIVYAFVAGYFVTWCTTWIVGFEFENFNTVALFASIAVLSFLFLIQACLAWFGLPVIALFVLLMFYGLPLIQLAPEMLPEFYQNYIVGWIPFKFLIEGLKDILFFGQGMMNANTSVLLWIFGVAIVLLWVKNVITKQDVEKPIGVEKSV